MRGIEAQEITKAVNWLPPKVYHYLPDMSRLARLLPAWGHQKEILNQVNSPGIRPMGYGGRAMAPSSSL